MSRARETLGGISMPLCGCIKAATAPAVKHHPLPMMRLMGSLVE